MQPHDPASPTRRRALALLGGAVAFGVGTSGSAREAARTRRPRALRREVFSLDGQGDDLAMYREGVRLMRARSARDPLDPLGWTSHAIAHTIFCATTEYARQVHYGWLFLPWHRAYLWSLERKIQHLLGEPRFALPHWDWTRNPRLPASFFGADNPLADPTRIYGPDDEIPRDFLQLRHIMAAPDFSVFGGYPAERGRELLVEGELEQGAHNNVHNWIGGHMASFDGAGYDPLFQLHHGAIDRLWAAWLAADPSHRNPDDPAWLEASVFLYGIRGPERIKVRELVDPAALGYGWDSLDFALDVLGRGAPTWPSGADGAVARVPIALPPGRAAAIEGPTDGRRVRLVLDRVQIPVHPLCIRLFVGPADLGATPGFDSPAYVGTVTLLPIFASTGALQPEVHIQLDLPAPVLAALRREPAVVVTALPVPLRGRVLPTEPLRLLGARLVVA